MKIKFRKLKKYKFCGHNEHNIHHIKHIKFYQISFDGMPLLPLPLLTSTQTVIVRVTPIIFISRLEN